jgi:RHS repeat-associated protein
METPTLRPTPTSAGSIDPWRKAGLHGTVYQPDGSPLAAVSIAIADHAEYGSTVTDSHGQFAVNVNGGGWLTVDYQKQGYLPVQRQISPLWQDDTVMPDVVMTPVDTQTTAVDLTAPTLQVARGGVVDDAGGTRQATLLFPPGTAAELVMPDGSAASITSLNVRATEYTVGASGPAAMPGDLPPASAYTYAVELSADEVDAAGASGVRFSQPIVFYVENFLGFPTGETVPVGYYDRAVHAWIPSASGRVISIVSVTGGFADIDADGDGAADDPLSLDTLGVTDAECQRLATLYQPGRSLWRVPISHFTAYDYNWARRLLDFDPPREPSPKPNGPLDDDCTQSGSLIECWNQILGEAVAVVGTPFSLHYQSDRAPGFFAARALEIPVSGTAVPSTLTSIELSISVAGRRFTHSLPALPNQDYTFIWDGLDVEGREVEGVEWATIVIDYVAGGFYVGTERFGLPGTGSTFIGNPTRQGVIASRVEVARFSGLVNSREAPVAGWSLSPHHRYDLHGRVLYLGDGRRRSTESVLGAISTVAGRASGIPCCDGGLATQAILGFTADRVAVGPDASLYIQASGVWASRIRRVDPNGIITTITGNGTGTYSGDGGPATLAEISEPLGIGVGPDGSVYITDTGNMRIRRVDPQGIITTVAGTGTPGYSGDGGPALLAPLSWPFGMAVAPDGSFYFLTGDRVRRVGPDGIITTVAGTGVRGYSGDGGLATTAEINANNDVQSGNVGLGPDGSLYIADAANHVIRRVDPQGIITTVAGTGGRGYSGDGGPATQAELLYPTDVAVAGDGTLYIADTYNDRIRRVGADGIITTVAGTGIQGTTGDGGASTAAQLSRPTGVAVGPDGRVYVATGGQIRALDSPLPWVALDDIVLPAEDGRQVYVFDKTGRHLRTLDAYTGARLHEFGYDDMGRLTSVTDGDDNVTTIERDGGGNPTAVVGPYGQRTTLSLDADGHLASITNPAGESHSFAYTLNGLLTAVSDPKGNARHFAYDELGRLVRDDDPAGGFKTLTRADTTDGHNVDVTTALGRATHYELHRLATSDQQRLVTAPNGLNTVTRIGTNGTRTTTFPDAHASSVTRKPDPRFGMQAPLPGNRTTTTPQGLASTITTQRVVTLTDPADPLTLASLTDTVTVNGRAYTSAYTASTRSFTNTTPAGRQSVTTIDTQGRPLQTQVAGLLPVTRTYDTHGRLATIMHGSGTDSRMTSVGYSTAGRVSSLTDALGRVLSFDYDDAGRVLTQMLADGRTITFTYDANGNVTAITPPGRSAHAFAYTPVDLESRYTPPNLQPPLSTPQTTYGYNADRQLTTITRPDGQTVTFGYDSAGRLSTLTLPGNRTIVREYDAITGRLATISGPDGESVTLSYDGPLLLGESWSGPVTGNVGRTFDNDFRVATEMVDNANSISFGYDNDSLLIGAGSETLTRSSQTGSITGTALGVVTDTRTYTGFGELSTYDAKMSGTSIYSAVYEDGGVSGARDKLGRITTKTESIGGVTDTFSYTYDTAGRLIDVNQNASPVAHYDYDSNGNRIGGFSQICSAIDGVVIDAQDRLLSFNCGAAAHSYAYAANGELTTKIVGSDTTAYSYDAFGNLLRVALPNNTAIDYLVDGRGRRVGKQVDGTLVQGFLYRDQLNPIAELDGSGTVVARFVYASRRNVPDYILKGGVTYRLITDHLGSPRLVINVTDGSIAQRMDYDEFGNVLSDTNPGFQPFGFAGGLYDRDTKLLRFGVRDYDPEGGRWTARDPMRFKAGDTNLYGYVTNDPVNFTDAWGARPGDRYDTDDSAGEAAIRDINPMSIREDIEYAGRVCLNSDGTYTYTPPNRGTKNTSTSGSCPADTKGSGDYHTHGADDPQYHSEDFSPLDMDLHMGDGGNRYLGTPSGAIKVFNPGTRCVRVLGTGAK